jgi:hypothetical protein
MIKTLFTSLARTSGTYLGDSIAVSGFSGGVFIADVTGTTAATSATIKVQGFDKVSEKWFDITGAAFAAIDSVTTKTLTVHPAVTATTIGINVAASQVLPDVIRGHCVVAALTTNAVTFSLSVHLKP